MLISHLLFKKKKKKSPVNILHPDFCLPVSFLVSHQPSSFIPHSVLHTHRALSSACLSMRSSHLSSPMVRDDQGELAPNSRASSFSVTPTTTIPNKDLKRFLCAFQIDGPLLYLVTVINALSTWYCICQWDNQPVRVWRAAIAPYYSHSPSAKHSEY